MIPKIIHYCWFGFGEKPESFYTCLESWKKFFPDYQILEWNETNSDIEHSNSYVKEAYQEKKYAFVSDYFRIKALYEYGGIYLDTDYEIIRPIESLLREGKLITGFESKESVLTAFIAVEKENPILKEFLDQYETRSFILESGKQDLTPINKHFSQLLSSYGIDLIHSDYQQTDNGICVYPVEVLCGFDMDNWHPKITKNTVGVHHMASSWVTEETRAYFDRIEKIQSIIGYRMYDFLKKNIYDKYKRKKRGDKL